MDTKELEKNLHKFFEECKVKGYPLEMEMSQSQQGMDMKILITATEVLTTPIDDATFTVSTEGYKMMSYKEMQEKMKAAKEEK